MPTLRLPDLDLRYELRGAGPRLLMFCGSGGTIETTAPLIDALAEHFTVAVHDQRCLGQTGLAADGRQPEMANYAADAAALLDHLGWPTAAVFGISFGGMVALEFAVTWPERVERLALLCTSPGGAGGSSFPLHEMAAMAADERAKVSLRNLDTRFDAAWLAEHPGDRAIVEMMAARAAAPKSDEQRRGEAMQLEARSRHDVWDRLHRIDCPTFVACGEFDGIAPPDNSVAIVSSVPRAELHRYQGGHLFAYQDRAALPDAVGFLAESPKLRG